MYVAMNLEETEVLDQVAAVSYHDVDGFFGYRVGDDGSVWTCRKPGRGVGTTKPWQRLKPFPDKAGRPLVKLWRDGRGYNRIVAHLVAEAFIGPRPSGLLVLHGDGEETNNTPGNLRYGTHQDNADDKERHGRTMRGDTHPLAKLDAGKVRAIRKELAAGRKSLVAIAEKRGVDSAVVARIRDGKAWAWVR